MDGSSNIDGLSEAELDALPFGAIQLALDGTILRFNEYEVKKASVDKRDAIGKNFFKEVAPCTDVKEFFGKFREGVDTEDLNAEFEYYFAFKQSPRHVYIKMFYNPTTKTVWVLISEKKSD